MTELHTTRLVLRPARPDDAPRYALSMGDYEVARWLTPMPWPFTLAMATDWLRQAPEPAPGRALFMVECPGKGLIGCVALNSEFGFWIARPHWGHGYATEAAAAVIDWHFATADARDLASSAHRDNLGSLRVKAKLGFVETGRDRRYSHALRHNVEHVLTLLTRTGWMAREHRQCA